MAYVFVADDFTGASDTLATLARGGLRVRLFRDVPQGADVAGLDAWGIATHARSLDLVGIRALARQIGGGLAAFAPDFVHVKICSTFDSGPDVGNTAVFAQGIADALGITDLAVISGQPSLGRYAVFGTLFARGPDDRVHRIDRHPVMSIHPVTPMHEADLIRHLATLGLNGLHHVGRGQSGDEFPRFYDTLDQADVTAAGRDLLASKRRVLVMGASSVAEAWLSTQPPQTAAVPAPAKTDLPVFAFAGSRSSLTTAQVGAAKAWARLPLNPADLTEGGPAIEAALDWCRDRLGRGQDSIVYLTAETAGAISPASLADETARFVARVLDHCRVGGLIVAGGDTSSAIVNTLAPAWLDHAGEICAGVPILRARMADHDLPLALKGGQMGGRDFFHRAIAQLRP